MILQSILYPSDICPYRGLYYQSQEEIIYDSEGIISPEKNRISFFSYFNMFDIDTWKKYTRLSKIQFSIEVIGRGVLLIKCKTKNRSYIISEYCFDTSRSNQWKKIGIDIDLEKNEGCCYFEINTDTEVKIKNAWFENVENSNITQKVQIALNICTYHRKNDVQRTLEQLRRSRFFQKDDMLFEKLYIVLIDNGSELELINEPNIKLLHNPNMGGAGGFMRGLEEIRKLKKEITHVVFMDDDIEFFSESLYRLYALLAYMKEIYQHESVAGRMFRTDRRWIQYTAAEIWNKGDLRHIGLNADMTQEWEILHSNDNSVAEYGGWWFCCFPMVFVKDNDPLPFFIHCDDVEYGLRHRGTPIILNGIQVWHETYEYRKQKWINYYDTRNPLFVNEILNERDGNEKTSNFYEDILEKWKKRIARFHLEKDWLSEYYVIIALYDWMKGQNELKKIDSGQLHQKLIKTRTSRLKNAVSWRYVEYKFRRNYLK